MTSAPSRTSSVCLPVRGPSLGQAATEGSLSNGHHQAAVAITPRSRELPQPSAALYSSHLTASAPKMLEESLRKDPGVLLREQSPRLHLL